MLRSDWSASHTPIFPLVTSKIKMLPLGQALTILFDISAH